MPALAEYPFAPKTFHTADGHCLSYLDEGSGPAVVMAHGNPSWSYLYRNVVTAFKGEYRCIVPDHLGCGLSDKPQDYPYRLRNHIDNFTALLDYLRIERCVLIVHDWGGAIGMGWAGQHPERVAGLVVLNTAAFRSRQLALRIAVCRWPLLGALLVRGLNGFAWPATFMAVCKKMRAEVKTGFLAPYNSWANRVAVHRFVQDIPLQPAHPSWSTLVEVENSLAQLHDKPMLICWGGQDFCFNDHFFAEWKERFPQADSHYFPDAGHYVLEDALPEIMNLLPLFLENCSGKVD
ncbi:MAG: haloalkane dehalogenase [Candidatus Electronema aureum]|uniref:Haloalkane dehalogenase n=1 Tax=Candidatus Electronema aureum TaxID=2005002 RepID=A0A521G2Q8_9BACT|nr:MAG: haloalkane dehalogenase [Candidatus Electronema aureum]